MGEGLEFGLRAVAIGAGATAVVDLWTVLLARLTGVPGLDWAMVGRWVGHFPRGRFRHDGIGRAAPVAGERALGWAVHYGTGIVFAALLLALCGLGWARNPTPTPALAFGLATVAAPFLLMQPALGAGIAASRTPNPAAARLRSLMTHAVFGIGLHLAALVTAAPTEA
ncbi:DUF2938 domain-containing protein [Inquilinus sp. Marseille-Q2685]|uniref:DUF2938 domain-containing protein n=1 Tax=Inquilinus sp. Marseille-Q2685 TaxID=2866581 RepID=UPI001CE4AF4A|nr:DUF2938 domain-containing protein [Inquilinus sp. Marseille-Q2685]